MGMWPVSLSLFDTVLGAEATECGAVSTWQLAALDVDGGSHLTSNVRALVGGLQ